MRNLGKNEYIVPINIVNLIVEEVYSIEIKPRMFRNVQSTSVVPDLQSLWLNFF